MASGRMNLHGKVKFNGGHLQDIQHSYVIQEDNLLRMSKLGGEHADCSGIDCSRDVEVHTRLSLLLLI